METKEVKKVTQNGALDIMKGIKDALELVEQIKAERDWQFKGEINFDETHTLKKLGDETLNQRKKLKRRINSFLARKSMRSANLFLRAVHPYLSDKGTAPRFEYSVKEKKIKEARKKYVEARDIAIKLYAEYKEEKGDYYKR